MSPAETIKPYRDAVWEQTRIGPLDAEAHWRHLANMIARPVYGSNYSMSRYFDHWLKVVIINARAEYFGQLIVGFRQLIVG